MNISEALEYMKHDIKLRYNEGDHLSERFLVIEILDVGIDYIDLAREKLSKELFIMITINHIKPHKVFIFEWKETKQYYIKIRNRFRHDRNIDILFKSILEVICSNKIIIKNKYGLI